MPYNFNFQAPTRPFVNAPTGAFSGLADTLEKKYNEGELITDAAKDLLGTIQFAEGDQIARNQFADQVNTGLNQLVSDYKGAYESKQFQRDAKNFIRKQAQNPIIRTMQETLDNVNFLKDLERKAAAEGKRLLAMGPDRPRASTYNPETGQWESFKNYYEVGTDWLGDAKNYVGKLREKIGTTMPAPVNVPGIGPMVASGQYAKVEKSDLENQISDVIDEFAESNTGGNQLARKIALDNGLSSIYGEDGKLNSMVRAGLYDYLYAAGRDQIHNNTQYDYRFLPEAYMSDSGTGGSATPTDATPLVSVPPPPKEQFGFTSSSASTSNTLGKIIDFLDPKDEGNWSVADGLRYIRDSLSKNDKEKYNTFIKDVASRYLWKDVDPNSEEAVDFTKRYFKALNNRQISPKILYFAELGTKGKSARDAATNDMQTHWTSAAFYSYDDGEQLSEKKVRKLDKSKMNVTGIIDAKNPITKATGNNAFSNAFYLEDSETGERYLMTMPESQQDPMNVLVNSLFNTSLDAFGTKVKARQDAIDALGYDDIEMRQDIVETEDGQIAPENSYNLWLDGEPVTYNGEVKTFSSFDEMLDAIIKFKAR